jgi:hypothetical protein
VGIEVERLKPNGKKLFHVEFDGCRHIVLPCHRIPVIGVGASKVGGASVALGLRVAHDVSCTLYDGEDENEGCDAGMIDSFSVFIVGGAAAEISLSQRRMRCATAGRCTAA